MAAKRDKKEGKAKQMKKQPAKKPVVKEKPEKFEVKPAGVIQTILNCIETKGPVTRDDIHKILCKKFPERDSEKMKKTLRVQVGVSRPTRLEKEQKVSLIIDKETGEISLKKNGGKKEKVETIGDPSEPPVKKETKGFRNGRIVKERRMVL